MDAGNKRKLQENETNGDNKIPPKTSRKSEATSPEDVDVPTPDHWKKLKKVSTKQEIFDVFQNEHKGKYLEATDPKSNDETALLTAVRLHKVDCVLALLILEANIDAKDRDGNGVLHLVVKTGDLDLLHVLIIFGADGNVKNNDDKTPLDLLQTADNMNHQIKSRFEYCMNLVCGNILSKEIYPPKEKHDTTYLVDVYTASDWGAGTDAKIFITMYSKNDIGKSERLLLSDNENLKADSKHSFSLDTKDIGDIEKIELELEASTFSVGSAWKFTMIYIRHIESLEFSGFPGFKWIDGQKLTIKRAPVVEHFLLQKDRTEEYSGERVLSLDGGGIKGLILVQILMEIEKHLGKDKDGNQIQIKDVFDWIAGTSTGGILALAIVNGKPLRFCQSIYFQLKDRLFHKKFKPYDGNILGSFLKEIFGEDTTMRDAKPPEVPKVVVTTVMADRLPAELHLVRNYDPPNYDETDGALFDRPEILTVWEAGRSTGAAPYYFTPYRNFIDGGMMSNNPTLDILTEIDEHTRYSNEREGKRDPLKVNVVVSLGCGRPFVKPARVPDLSSLNHLIENGKNLGEVLLDQATQAEGQVVYRSMAWCNMINSSYFRFNPPLKDEIEMDCSNDNLLVTVLWQTKYYLLQQQQQIKALATMLKAKKVLPK